jgi:hypothetical protein
MVKWNRLLLITASMGLLAACDNAAGTEEPAEEVEETEVEAEATTGATQVRVNDEDSLLEGLSSDGAWIVIFEDDITTDEDLVMVEGFENKGETERKLALYAQDADRNVTETFTLTAPSITIQNENTRLQYGTFVGDVYVEAEGFKLYGGTIDGDLIFASEELQESAEIDDDATVTGEIKVEGAEGEAADVTTGATQVQVSDEASLLEGLSSNGAWIVMFEDDITTDEDLVMVDGFENKGESERKLALYQQDADRNLTASFTLTAPSITLQNDNTRLQNGTFVGDVYVEANGFKLVGGTIDGDLIFASEEFEASSEIDENSEVTGEIKVD